MECNTIYALEALRLEMAMVLAYSAREPGKKLVMMTKLSPAGYLDTHFRVYYTTNSAGFEVLVQTTHNINEAIYAYNNL